MEMAYKQNHHLMSAYRARMTRMNKRDPGAANLVSAQPERGVGWDGVGGEERERGVGGEERERGVGGSVCMCVSV